MDETEITEVVRGILRERFPLFEEEHSVNVVFDHRSIWIGYRTNDNAKPKGSTHFDLEIEAGTCHVDWTEIPEEQRGLGYGRAMSFAIQHIAKSLFCSRLEAMFNGITKEGTPVIDTVHKRGYVKIQGHYAEKLI